MAPTRAGTGFRDRLDPHDSKASDRVLAACLRANDGRIGGRIKTIHRLLGVDPQSGGFHKDQDNPLDADFLVVDEASMIDVPLMHALVKAASRHAAVLIVGDIDQLPSVGPGQVLADLIASGAIARRLILIGGFVGTAILPSYLA